MRGFAFLLAFAWAAAILSAIATSASLSSQATFFEEKFEVLELRNAVGWDVQHAFSALRTSVTGRTAEQRAADWAAKTAAFAHYLEMQYPVSARLLAGPPLVVEPLLRSLLEGSRAFDCPACRFQHPGVFGAAVWGDDWAGFEVLA